MRRKSIFYSDWIWVKSSIDHRRHLVIWYLFSWYPWRMHLIFIVWKADSSYKWCIFTKIAISKNHNDYGKQISFYKTNYLGCPLSPSTPVKAELSFQRTDVCNFISEPRKLSKPQFRLTHFCHILVRARYCFGEPILRQMVTCLPAYLCYMLLTYEYVYCFVFVEPTKKIQYSEWI